MAENVINPFAQGPYVQVASFCERVLSEADGVCSLIRLVDIITHFERGADAPRDMPGFRNPLWLVLFLKAGRARGRHEVTVTPELPSGESLPSTTVTVQMQGEGRGVAVRTNVDIEYTLEGLYWFRVDFDGTLLTRLPLEVRYSRAVSGTTSTRPS